MIRDDRSGLLIPRHLKGKIRLLGKRFAPVALYRKNPVVAGIEYVQDWAMYDSVNIAAATDFPTTTTLFATPVSSGRTEAQTNMQLASVLPAPERFVVHGISCWIRNDAVLEDALNFQVNTIFDWKIGQKSYLKGVNALLTSGRGTVVNAASQVGTAPTGSSVVTSISNGVPDPRAIFTLTKPVEIAQGERLALKIQKETDFTTAAASTNPAGTGLTIYYFLEGLLYNGVQ